MCTVSFVIAGGKYILTSNRDEKISRPEALPPQYRMINGKKLFFPEDPKGGGSWFILNMQGTISILLNGAHEKHRVEPIYRKSRGRVLLEINSADDPLDFWKIIDLRQVEPFTIVLFFCNNLFQLLWDGQLKERVKLDTSANHIWSSVTLYPEEVRVQREEWFNEFLNKNAKITGDDMFYFHTHTGKHDRENGLLIDRDGIMKTKSVSQVVVDKNTISFLYQDLVSNELFRENIIVA